MTASASSRRLAANRANAQKSTGPRTEEGKTASRKNALRHGLTAKTVVLDVEDPAEYQAFRSQVIQAFVPAPGVEQLLTEQLADALWRLKRAQRIETSAFDHYLNTLKHEIFPDDASARDGLVNDIGLGVVIADEYAEPFQKMFRYVGAAERFYLRLQTQLLKIQAERRRNGFVSSPPVQPEKLRPTRLRPVQRCQVVPENSRRVVTVHADSLQNSPLVPENTGHPTARKERGVGSE